MTMTMLELCIVTLSVCVWELSSCMMSPVMYKISTSFLSLHCTKLRIRTDSLNANEIANGVLSCLVAITASCPYVTYWQACIIGSE